MVNFLEGIQRAVYATYATGTTLKKYNAQTLEEIWEFANPAGSVKDVTLDTQGCVFVTTNDNDVFKLDPDGNEIWQNTTSLNENGSSLAVDLNGDVYVCEAGATSPGLFKLDGINGDEIWNEASDGGGTARPDSLAYSQADDLLWAGYRDGDVKKHDPATGTVLATFALWSVSNEAAVGMCTDEAGNVYIGGRNGSELKKINSAGAVQWTKTGFDNLKQIVADENFIYAAEFGGASTVYKFDPATGNTLLSNTTDFTDPFGIAVYRDISELTVIDRSTDKIIRLNNDLVKIGEVTFTPAGGNPLFLGSSDGEIGSGIWANS